MARFPHFIIIGAGKCGTTSLHDYLSQHPDVYLCPKKETFFFMNAQSREINRKWGGVATVEDYLALFEEAPETDILGEISTIYYAHPESAELIKDAIPDVKIIAILRDPSDRAFSAYQMYIRNGGESRSFSETIEARAQYITKGFYYQELSPFYKVFNSDNIKILMFEDLVKNPTVFLKELFEFIDVNADFYPDMSKRGREGGLPKRPWLHKLLTKDNPIRTSMASLIKLFLPLEKRQSLRTKLVKGNIAKEKMDEVTRQQLIGIYRDDIQQLEGLINRDLSHWLS